MATQIIRPDATVSNQWTIVGLGTAHAVLGQVVTQPTAPSASNRVAEATSGETCEVSLADPNLSGLTITSAQLWANVDAAATAGGATAQMYIGAGTYGSAISWTAVQAQAWLSTTQAGVITPAQANDMRIRLTKSDGGIASCRVFCAYVELTVVPAGGRLLMGVG